MRLDQSMKNAAKRALAAAAIALLLTGCTPSRSPADRPAQPVTSKSATLSPSQQAAADKRAVDAFLKTIRKAHPRLDSIPDAELIAVGKSACPMYKKGATLSEIQKQANEMYGDKFKVLELANIMGGGLGAFCPEYTDQTS